MAFREHASGLLVPEEVSRARRSLTWQEWRDLERATRLLGNERMAAEFVMRCKNPQCVDRKIERVRGGHGMILRCGCTDRVFSKGY